MGGNTGFYLAWHRGSVGLDAVAPRVTDQYGGALVLGGIGLAFLVVYLLNRAFWWAIIPMGVMFTLVVLILVEGFMGEPAVVFFLGLAATFGVVALLPVNNGKRMSWPLIPAGVLLFVGLLVGMGENDWTRFIMPIVVILVGGYLVLRAMRQKA